MKMLPVRDKFVIVDDDDFNRLSAYSWRFNSKGYAIRTVGKGKDQKLRSMHREILNMQDSELHVDHIDGNKLNNAKSNLRVVSRSQNMQNRLMYVNNKSGFKGVHFHKKAKRWGADIKVNNKKKWLGLFDTPEEAHEVYCLAADLLHGQYANHG